MAKEVIVIWLTPQLRCFKGRREREGAQRYAEENIINRVKEKLTCSHASRVFSKGTWFTVVNFEKA